MKKNSSILIGVVVIIILIIGGYLIFHKSPKTVSSTTYSTSTSSSSTTSKSPGHNPADAGKNQVVLTETSSSVGSYLADSNGNTLYTYGSDTSGVSNCTGECLTNWPAYTATTTTSLPANVTFITRSDGSKQYAYKGLPLYTFTGDSAGKVTGNGVSNFHVAKP